MTQKVADQHAVTQRGWEIAGELAEALRANGHEAATPTGCSSCAALRRYEEARDA